MNFCTLIRICIKVQNMVIVYAPNKLAGNEKWCAQFFQVDNITRCLQSDDLVFNFVQDFHSI